MNNYQQSGDVLDLAPTAAVASGVGFLFGTGLFGVAQQAVAANVVGSFRTKGVVTLGKTAALVVAVGTRVFWDPVGKVVNATVTAQQCVGIAVAASGAGDTTVKIRLGAFLPVGV